MTGGVTRHMLPHLSGVPQLHVNRPLGYVQTDKTTPNVRLHGAKSMTGSNFAQQHSTTCNGVCKPTQYLTSNNAGSCWPTCCVRLHAALYSRSRQLQCMQIIGTKERFYARKRFISHRIGLGHQHGRRDVM